MISDSERREVASELREMSEDDSFAAEVFCRNDSYDALVLRAIRAVVGKGEIFGVLADLIDRPTCEMRAEGEGFRCSACGEFHDMSGFDKFPWPYCPNCGAEVVDDAD